MSNPTLDKFGELLMKRVRDKAIGDWERMVTGEMKGTTAAKVQQQIALLDVQQRDALQKLIPQIIDTTLHHLLFMVEQERSLIPLMSSKDGVDQNLREISDGLSGELYGNHGWIARFSTKSREGI
jgi:predicted PhzF superfamily epimerase YddE/YHI9